MKLSKELLHNARSQWVLRQSVALNKLTGWKKGLAIGGASVAGAAAGVGATIGIAKGVKAPKQKKARREHFERTLGAYKQKQQAK